MKGWGRGVRGIKIRKETREGVRRLSREKLSQPWETWCLTWLMICALAPPQPRRCPPGVALPLPCRCPARNDGPWLDRQMDHPTNNRQQPPTNHQWTNHQPSRPDSTKPQSLYPIAPDPNGNDQHHYLMSYFSLSLITRKYLKRQRPHRSLSCFLIFFFFFFFFFFKVGTTATFSLFLSLSFSLSLSLYR